MDKPSWLLEFEQLPQSERDELKKTPDHILRYIAPMAMGWKYRAELCRRLLQGEEE